jgi:hypothetical protein
MTTLHDLTREASRSLAGRLERLHDRLAALGEALREEVARAVSGTVAEAARAAVYKLLDALLANAPRRARSPAWDDDNRDDDWPGQRDPWDAEDDWGRDQADRCAPGASPQQRLPWRRWQLALTATGQAAAGLGRRGHKLPALAAALAGLAAGLLAAPSGTALTAGAAAATTALALVGIADAARRSVHRLARWAAPARL